MPPADPVALARTLVQCPSVTPDEGGALVFLERLLSRAGFAVERVTFSEPGTPDIENLYARIGTEPPVLVFAGHTDVVPPGDAARWRHPPFAGAIEGGHLFGRGVEDMKGAIACFAAAALGFLAEHGPPKGSIAFLITGDEEGPAINGTVKLIDWAVRRGERFDHCVLGEPTSRERLGDTMKIGRRGSLNGTLTVHGKQGHVAYPERAENPIRGMTRLIAALQDAPLDAPTAHFEASNLEVTSVDVGNPATNVIPAEARAQFNIRFNDRWTAETLAEALAARLREAAGNAVRYTLTFEPSNSPVFLTEPGPFVAMLAGAIRAETGLEPALSTTGGTSDARFIKNVCPVVEFGLVGRTMHQVDERVPVAEIEMLTRIYRGLLEGYFAQR
jgi:succinyl-diaminopimelate desuccinylase